MGPQDKFDLLIKGGEVFDPSQSLRAKRDIGMRFGKIEALEADIPATRALRVLDASGKVVLPGLVDLHSHVYPYGSALGIPADELVPYQGSTTMVSAGDAGANNFAAFRRYVQAQTRTRLYAFVHIANIGLAGFPVPELFNISYADPLLAAKTIAENADMVLGVKVRMSENVIDQHGLEPLKRAISACEMARTRASSRSVTWLPTTTAPSTRRSPPRAGDQIGVTASMRSPCSCSEFCQVNSSCWFDTTILRASPSILARPASSPPAVSRSGHAPAKLS